MSPPSDRAVVVDLFRAEVPDWCALELEVAISVVTTHQCGRIAENVQLTQASRNVADGKADAAVVGAVGLRVVERADVMERHFSRL